MSVPAQQSFANLCNAFWLKAGVPVQTISPLDVIDNNVNPTKTTSIQTLGNGSSTIAVKNYPSGTNPVGIRLAQGLTQPSNNITFNVGNVNPVMTMNGTGISTTLPMTITKPLTDPGSLILDVDGNYGKISGGFGAVKIGDTFLFNDSIIGGGMVFSDFVSNSNIFAINGTYFAKNNGAYRAGMAVNGTALQLGVSTTFDTTSPAILIDNTNITQIRSSSFRICDPVNPSTEYLNFSNSGGAGYIDLVSGNVLYPQFQFTPTGVISTNPIVVGAGGSNMVLSSNEMNMKNSAQKVGQVLNAGDNREYFYTSNLSNGSNYNAMIVNTNGVVVFPQGVDLTTSSLTVTNLNATGFIRSGSNVWDGWADSNLRIINQVIAGSPPNPERSLLGYPSIDPQTYRPDLYSNFTWFKLWFPTEFVVDTSGPINLFFAIKAHALNGPTSILLWNCNFAPSGPATQAIRNGPISYWNYPTSDVSGSNSSYGFGQLCPIMCHKSLFPIYVTGYIADPPNAQNQYRVFNGTFPPGGVGSPVSDIPFALEGWY